MDHSGYQPDVKIGSANNETTVSTKNDDDTTKPDNNKVGILRYFTVAKTAKRKRNNSQQSPTSTNNRTGNANIPLSNRFNALNEVSDDSATKPKPPPIYIRLRSTAGLETKIKQIAKHPYHIVDLRRGALYETKVQTSDGADYANTTRWLDAEKLQYYSYETKENKGLRVIIKGIDHQVKPEEIKGDLERQHFQVKWVSNVLNRYKKPQPMFKVELMPTQIQLQRGKVHPIYGVKFVVSRRVTVEDPYKRKGPVQCQNCQEYGHTRTYCKLKSVCVRCGDNHVSQDCKLDRENPTNKKCSNCGMNHTANYRGCSVYKALNNQIKSSQRKPTLNTAPAFQNIPAGFPNLPNSHPDQNPSNPSYTNSQNKSRTYAETLSQNQIPQLNNDISQILLTLINNIQQLTNSLVQMQEMQRQQLEFLSKIVKP